MFAEDVLFVGGGMRTYRQRKMKQIKRLRRAEVIARHRFVDPFDGFPPYMRAMADAVNSLVSGLARFRP